MYSSSDKTERAGGRNIARRVPTTVLSVAVGIALIALAVPRFVAELIMAPANQYLAALQAGSSSLTAENLETLAGSRKRALSWFPSGQTHLELALAEIQLAARDEARAAEYMQDARRHLEQGLSRKPAEPYAWTQVATLAALSQEPTERINSALKMAFTIAPFDPKLTHPRLGVALALWPVLEPSLRERAVEQVRIAWQKPDMRGIPTEEREPRLRAWQQQRQQLVESAQVLGQISVLQRALSDEQSSRELNEIISKNSGKAL